MLDFIPFNQKNYLEVALYGGLSLACFFIHPILGFVLLHGAALAAWSLRSTKRVFHPNENDYISPIDGKVINIDTRCIRNGIECIKITIETGLTDSHAQYAPISGSIVSSKVAENQTTQELAKVGENSGIEIVYESKLNTDLVDSKNKTCCLVETSAKLFFGLPLSPLEKIEYSSDFVDQGDQIGVWHCLPCSSFITHVYIDAGSDINISTGYRVFGGQTVLASRIPQISGNTFDS